MKKILFVVFLLFNTIFSQNWELNNLVYGNSITKIDTSTFLDSALTSNIIDSKGYQIFSFNFPDTLGADTLTIWHSDNDSTGWTTLYDFDNTKIWEIILSSQGTKDYILPKDKSYIHKRYFKITKTDIILGNQSFSYTYGKINLK